MGTSGSASAFQKLKPAGQVGAMRTSSARLTTAAEQPVSSRWVIAFIFLLGALATPIGDGIHWLTVSDAQRSCESRGGAYVAVKDLCIRR